MNCFQKLICFLLVLASVCLCGANVLAADYSPAYRVRSTVDPAGTGMNEARAVLYLPGNSEIKGVGATGAAYNYLGLETASGHSLEVGFTKDRLDLENNRWSVFAYANYDGAFAAYQTEGRWVNFRPDGASFAGPHITVPDGSVVSLRLQVAEQDEVVLEIDGWEKIRLKVPGADPAGEQQVFRRVTSLMTDDPQGFFRNTRWSSLQIKKSGEGFADWTTDLSDVLSSNNMDKNDPASSWISVVNGPATEQTVNIIMSGASDKTYAFNAESQSEESLRVQFTGNQMFHGEDLLGFGVDGKPMLSVRYLAQRFGCQVDYDGQTGNVSISQGQYCFRLNPASRVTEIFWAGEKVRERELVEKPLLRNNTLYLYSLDISDLLGLSTYWDGEARTWDVVYRNYLYQELSYPAVVNDDGLTVKGLLLDDGRRDMPQLELTDAGHSLPAQSGSVSMLETGADGRHKYVMSSTVQLLEETNRLRVILSLKERIIFCRSFEVARHIRAKELVVEPPYQLVSPDRGYLEVEQPRVTISGLLLSGSGAGSAESYPAEVVVFVKKAYSGEILQKESIPVVDGRFAYELELKNGGGLYNITINSVMAAPRGLAYPEITNFYLDYQAADAQ
jgi:hypothetical protein